ncbi:glutathione S-transferase theta-1-like, partial [Poecilia reticulata]|uniref:glutathione S-transferase theta-1-like n=1 Tax=Poecilia reticulata TaxID=8081 RepID=UPI0007E9F0BB
SHCSKVVLLRIMHQPLMDCEALKEKLDATLEDMKQPLDLLEEKFLQDKPFIIGNKICLADLVEMMQPLGVGVDPFQGRPKLTAWRGRVKKQLGVKLVDQAHEALLDLSGLQQKMQNNTELQKLKPVFLKYFH